MVKRKLGRWMMSGAMALAMGVANTAPAHAEEPVSEAELRADVETLASDAFGGRKPGTAGETLTAHHIARGLADAGLVGGMPDGGWYQPVPLIELRPRESSVTLLGGGSPRSLESQLIVRAYAGHLDLDRVAPLFVGYGVDGPGRAAAEVAGRVVIMLAAEPARPGAPGLRARRDALIAAGARGILVALDDATPFAAVQRMIASGAPQLAGRNGSLEFDGMLSTEAAAALLAGPGVTAQDRLAAARHADFQPIVLDQTVSITAVTDVRQFNSYNVIGRLPGRRSEGEAVLLTGHWDHLGECRPAGAEDRICNGAVDNASGIAALLAAARRLGSGARPDRDILIVATTAEEMGLLGATHFVANPTLPAAKIFAVLNVDTIAIAPRGAPVAIVGIGRTSLDATVRDVAHRLGRRFQDRQDANAFIRRQDGWAFVQAGIPAIMAGGSFADMPLLQSFLGGHYHGPDDELTPDLPLGGAADDADLHVALARQLADRRLYPHRPVVLPETP